MGLGGYPTVSLAAVRDLAKEARELHKAGRNRIKERKAAAQQQRLADARSITFRELVESLAAGWRNPKHREQWNKSLEEYVYPVFADVPVADVNTDLVLKVLKPIWVTKIETASGVRGRIERVLSAAKVLGLKTRRSGAVTWKPAAAKVQGTQDQTFPGYDV